MPELTNEERKERVRRRVRAATDPESYTYIPETEKTNYVKSDEFQRVAIYARVSTEDPAQTSSFELQQKYYMNLVAQHPKWELVKIYSDEGKSGTTTQHREGFLEMLHDAYDGKIDLIIVKNISRLARNVVDFLSTIRKLREKKVGVLFESEAIYSLNQNSHLALSFQATIAEEESRVRSRSMETSLRMRLDHGLPLTPELLGFVKDENGKLVINEETYKIPKLIFSMYLYGYSTEQIADKLTRLSKRTYLGNIKWSAGGIADTLRNERYCGDVLTRKRYKVFAPDAGEQKTFKNRGEKPQSYYRGEHEAIISRDDFLAAQRIMDNAKFGGTSRLPELKVIPEGLLKGYVIIHPRWGSFSENDYMEACRSVWKEDTETEVTVRAEEGSFDFRGYEVVDFKLFDDHQVPAVVFRKDSIQFNLSCIRKMGCDNYIEMLVHPVLKKIAIRPAAKDNRNRIQWASGTNTNRSSRCFACMAYIRTLYQIFGWDPDFKYKLYGVIYHDGSDSACVFSDINASVYIDKDQYLSAEGVDASGQLLSQSGKHIRALAGDFENAVGKDYYVEMSMNEIAHLTKEQWQTRIEGQLCGSRSRLNVTPYEELREFIMQELGELFEEVEEK